MSDCQSDWRQEAVRLSSSDLRVALDLCADAAEEELPPLSCEQLVEAYSLDESDPD